MRSRLALLVTLLMPAAAAAQPSRPAEHMIAITGMRFGALPAHVKAGDSILWVNRDVVPHTASARDRSFDVTIQPRQSVRITVQRAGNIAFYCRFHPAMGGVLRVTGR